MKLKKIASIVLTVILSTSIYSCSSNKTSHKDPNVVAKIDKELVEKTEIDEYYAGLENGFIEQYGEDYKDSSDFNSVYVELVNQYLDQKVLVKFAEDQNIVDEVTVQEKVDEDFQNMREVFVNDEAFETALINSRYKDEEDYKSKLKISIIIEELIKSETDNMKISDKDIEAYYNANEDKFLRGPGADVYHIFLNDEEMAQTVLDEIDSGEDFETAATNYGKDGSAAIGGYLGYQEFDNSELVEDFMVEVRDMKEGEIRGPVETQFGYHIIKVENIHNDDWIKPLKESTKDIEDTLKAEKTSEVLQILVDKAREKYKVHVYEDNISGKKE